MDFSAVSNLTLKDVQPKGCEVLVSSLASMLPALEALSISGSWGLDFLRALPGVSLSHLPWRFSGLAGDKLIDSANKNDNDGGDSGSEHLADASNGHINDEDCSCRISAEEADATLREIWLRHGGPQLESLEFRGAESASRHGREVLTVSQLRAVAAAGSNLRKLTIDLDRNEDTWPEKKLKVLATEFPALQSLTLYLELASNCRQELEREEYPYGSNGLEAFLSMQERETPQSCNREDQFRKSLVNKTTAADLSAFMGRLNMESGSG